MLRQVLRLGVPRVFVLAEERRIHRALLAGLCMVPCSILLFLGKGGGGLGLRVCVTLGLVLW